ncbi:hypothetical protein PIB30_070735 [Stylosanthes scabra]|uniref:Uncharacterized protein n=1 Tax=Stylosanthes scabra TaxID=79078 RepID=A0ABU6XPV9_9FABA|nr:hypothetical protein [Stylosanthes scabra]
MARQMGFSQAIPAPYSMDPNKQICRFVPHSFKEIKSFLLENLLTRTFYDRIACRTSNFVTKGFIKWWDAYYRQYNMSLDEMIAGINRKKKQMKEGEKLLQEEKTTQKRKVEPSKVPSKRAKLTSKKALENVDLQEVRIKSKWCTSKVNFSSEKLRTAESTQSASGDSLNDVSSRSKESSNSNRTKSIPDVERTEEPIIPEPDRSLDIILNGAKSPHGLSFEGYFLSSSPKSIEKTNPLLEEIDKALDNPEKLEETGAASVEKVKQSMKPLPSIPIIEIGTGDSDLDDLLQVISETKAGSEQVSNSDTRSVQQEKEDTPIQKARSDSLQKVLLKSAAEKNDSSHESTTRYASKRSILE